MAENAINNAAPNSASNAELEAMKQEILREMRKEMAKMKQDIIEGKHTQCGNLAILLPIRFYVKSMFVCLESQNMQF